MTDLIERLPDPQRIAPVKAAPVSTMCDNWPIAYQTGNSQEDGEDWGIVTDNVRASLFVGLDFPLDAKDDAEFLAYLVNAYRTGQLVPATAQAAEIARLTAERDGMRQAIARLLPVAYHYGGLTDEHVSAINFAETTIRDFQMVRLSRSQSSEAQVADAYARGLREAAGVADYFRDQCGECPWTEEAVIAASNIANEIGCAILALIPKPATEKPE